MHDRHQVDVHSGSSADPAATSQRSADATTTGGHDGPVGYLPARRGDYRGIENVVGARDVELSRRFFKAIAEKCRYPFRFDVPDEVAARPRIPAGYTYLGQFASHDLSHDGLRFAGVEHDVEPRNLRRRPLMLATLYGDDDDRARLWFADAANGDNVRLKFRLNGATSLLPARAYCPYHAPLRDIGRAPRGDARRTDLPAATSALIADIRNDDQPMLSQIVALMQWAHNLAVDRLAVTGPAAERDDPRWLFSTARAALTVAFRRIIAADYLPRLLHPDVHHWYRDRQDGDEVRFLDDPDGPAAVSREFANAAFRMGHAMVRPTYRFNPHRSREFTLTEALSQSSRFDVLRHALNENWVTDFANFYDFDGAPPPLYASPIGPFFASPMGSPTFFDVVPGEPYGGLTYRDLSRGAVAGIRRIATLRATVKARLPRLYAACPWLNDAKLGRRALISWWRRRDTAADAAPCDRFEQEVVNNPPPFLYFLVEAAAAAGGRSFGPLGSIIIADTFHRALELWPVPANDKGAAARDCALLVFGDDGPNSMPALVEWVDRQLGDVHKHGDRPLPLIGRL